MASLDEVMGMIEIVLNVFGEGVLEKRGQIMPPPFVDVAGSFLEF